MKITELSIKNRIATGVIVLAFLALGIFGFNLLPVNLLPTMKYPFIIIRITWIGASSEEVERNIATIIEKRIATINGLDYFTSSCQDENYSLFINFLFDVSIDDAYQDVLAAMSRVANDLPTDIQTPFIIKADPSQLPIADLIIKSDTFSSLELRSWTENWFQDRLASVHGIASTEIRGGLVREIRVNLIKNALEKYNIPLSSVLDKILGGNTQEFAGRVSTGKKEYLLNTQGYYNNIKEIGSLLVDKNEKANIYIKDIADVTDAHQTITEYTRYKRKPCVILRTYKQADANTVDVVNEIQSKIEELKPAFPPGTEINILNNQAFYIQSALKGVYNSSIEAAIILILIVYFFLGSLRHVLVMLIALPTTIIINFGFMKLAGFSLNIFSLSGLVIAMGIIIDNSTVVVENITRLRREQGDVPLNELAYNGTKEVGSAIVAATLSFLALLFPFLLIHETISLLFKELIIVIAGTVIISLGVAITVTPTLITLVFSKKKKEKDSRFDKAFDKIREFYEKLLVFSVKYKWITMFIFVSVFVVAVFYIKSINSEFLPKVDDGMVVINIQTPVSSSIDEIDRILTKIENAVSKDDLIDYYYSYVNNNPQLNIQLIPWNKRSITTINYIKKLREKLSKLSIEGARISVAQNQIRGIPRMGSADLELKIKGPRLDDLYKIAGDIMDRGKKISHVSNLNVSVQTNELKCRVFIDRVKAAQLGIPVKLVAQTLQTFITGTVPTQYNEKDEFYDIRVIIPEEKIKSFQDIENLTFYSPQNRFVKLYEIAKVVPAVGPVELDRENQIRLVTVRGDIKEVPLGQAINELEDNIKDIRGTLAAGYTLEYGGQADLMGRMVSTIIKLLLFAIFFSFVILAVQFNNLKYPFQILICIPICFAGLVFMLYLTNVPMGSTVIISLLIVVSATVNDGVLLLTLADDLRIKEKFSPFDAIVRSAKIRLRPRLMITVTAIVGLMPLALNLEGGGEMLQPMAIGAIGGLIFEMFVALLLMPCIYVLFNRNRVKT